MMNSDGKDIAGSCSMTSDDKAVQRGGDNKYLYMGEKFLSCLSLFVSPPITAARCTRSVIASCYDGRGIFDSTKKKAHSCVTRPNTIAVPLYLGEDSVKQYE